jgi:hypothetical protein
VGEDQEDDIYILNELKEKLIDTLNTHIENIYASERSLNQYRILNEKSNQKLIQFL